MGVKSAFISPRSASIPMTLSGSSRGIVVASTVATNVETPIIKPGDDSAEQLIDDESEQDVLISGANTKISFDSIQKVIFATVSMALLSYCAVSPRSVPFPEYNRLFLQNLSIVAIGTIAPVVMFLSVFDGKYNNINAAVSCQRKLSIELEFLLLPPTLTSVVLLFCGIIFHRVSNEDWDVSCFLHLGVRLVFNIRSCSNHSSSVGSVQDLGTGHLFFNSHGTIDYIAMGIARETVQAEEDHIVRSRLYRKLFG